MSNRWIIYPREVVAQQQRGQIQRELFQQGDQFPGKECRCQSQGKQYAVSPKHVPVHIYQQCQENNLEPKPYDDNTASLYKPPMPHDNATTHPWEVYGTSKEGKPNTKEEISQQLRESKGLTPTPTRFKSIGSQGKVLGLRSVHRHKREAVPSLHKHMTLRHGEGLELGLQGSQRRAARTPQSYGLQFNASSRRRASFGEPNFTDSSINHSELSDIFFDYPMSPAEKNGTKTEKGWYSKETRPYQRVKDSIHEKVKQTVSLEPIGKTLLSGIEQQTPMRQRRPTAGKVKDTVTSPGSYRKTNPRDTSAVKQKTKLARNLFPEAKETSWSWGETEDIPDEWKSTTSFERVRPQEAPQERTTRHRETELVDLWNHGWEASQIGQGFVRSTFEIPIFKMVGQTQEQGSTCTWHFVGWLKDIIKETKYEAIKLMASAKGAMGVNFQDYEMDPPNSFEVSKEREEKSQRRQERRYMARFFAEKALKVWDTTILEPFAFDDGVDSSDDTDDSSETMENKKQMFCPDLSREQWAGILEKLIQKYERLEAACVEELMIFELHLGSENWNDPENARAMLDYYTANWEEACLRSKYAVIPPIDCADIQFVPVTEWDPGYHCEICIAGSKLEMQWPKVKLIRRIRGKRRFLTRVDFLKALLDSMYTKEHEISQAHKHFTTSISNNHFFEGKRRAVHGDEIVNVAAFPWAISWQNFPEDGYGKGYNPEWVFYLYVKNALHEGLDVSSLDPHSSLKHHFYRSGLNPVNSLAQVPWRKLMARGGRGVHLGEKVLDLIYKSGQSFDDALGTKLEEHEDLVTQERETGMAHGLAEAQKIGAFPTEGHTFGNNPLLNGSMPSQGLSGDVFGYTTPSEAYTSSAGLLQSNGKENSNAENLNHKNGATYGGLFAPVLPQENSSQYKTLGGGRDGIGPAEALGIFKHSLHQKVSPLYHYQFKPQQGSSRRLTGTPTNGAFDQPQQDVASTDGVKAGISIQSLAAGKEKDLGRPEEFLEAFKEKQPTVEDFHGGEGGNEEPVTEQCLKQTARYPGPIEHLSAGQNGLHEKTPGQWEGGFGGHLSMPVSQKTLKVLEAEVESPNLTTQATDIVEDMVDQGYS